MIQFEILSSPDTDMVGEHLYYQDELQLGYSIGDVLIDDQKIRNHQFIFKVFKDDIFIVSQTTSGTSFLIDDKRVSGSIKIKTNQKILLGDTLIQIGNFLWNEEEKSSQKMMSNLKMLINENSPILNVIDIIEEYLDEIKDV
jgi:hypothetical protein